MSPVRQHQLLGLGLGVVDIGIDLKALHHVFDQRILPFTSVKAPMDPDLFRQPVHHRYSDIEFIESTPLHAESLYIVLNKADVKSQGSKPRPVRGSIQRATLSPTYSSESSPRQ